jgi:hypothetical protein
MELLLLRRQKEKGRAQLSVNRNKLVVSFLFLSMETTHGMGCCSFLTAIVIAEEPTHCRDVRWLVIALAELKENLEGSCSNCRALYGVLVVLQKVDDPDQTNQLPHLHLPGYYW